MMTVRVGLLSRMMASASARHWFHNSGVILPLGSFKISNRTLSGAFLKCGATCRQKARNLALLLSASLPVISYSWKSRITLRFAARALVTTHSVVCHQELL